ncbi:MAG: hypothetical protein CMM87_06080 [Rickettsiales bacterium]|nr:hypothetical protein [Rickettsiales bacterium]|tara:strand:+ start:17739 stop:19073 length:1335 start_codon:yes stop_codon:yes gene_type:complete
MRLLLCLILISAFSSVEANKLEQFFRDIGSNANYTSPGHFQSQSAGHYTGGSLAIRNKTKSVQPFNVNLPKINAGCGGIDAYYGSFSFITQDQLVGLAKRVGAAAPAYAFKLGMKTFAPQIENTMSQLQNWIQEMNSFLLEDCRLVEAAFASALPKGSVMQQHACTDLTRRGEAPDWFGARESCKAGDTSQKKLEETFGKGKSDTLLGSYNLVSHACKKAGIDRSQCEFYMSTVGTVVSKEEAVPGAESGETTKVYKTRFYKPLSNNKKQLLAYVKGDKATKYQCNDDLCLMPREVEVTVDQKESLTSYVSKMVSTIQAKYNAGEAFTTSQTSFLETVGEKIPIYTYIQVSAVQASHIMDEASEYTAFHILLTNLEKITTDVETWIQQLESVQLDDTVLKAFKDGLYHLRQDIAAEMGRLEGKMMAFRTHVMGLERMITNRRFV